MTTAGWIFAVLGIVFGLTIVMAVLFDVRQQATGRTTISRWCLEQATSRLWVVLALSFFTGFLLGMLAGHLWLPQYVE